MLLVCGASGLLGKDLCNLLKKNNVDFIGTYNNNYINDYININFLNKNILYDTLSKYNITICINCIVERQVETCEGNWELTKNTNITITNNISKVCNELNIHLIHISTDYVFDGSSPPYYPNNTPNPLQNYGISKLISELKVINKCKKYTIIRVPVLYTDNIINLSENAVTMIGKKVLNRIEKYTEDNYSTRRPNYIPDFCLFIYDIIKNPINGIFHFCNPNDKVTKYIISNIIANYLNKNNTIIPIDIEPSDGVERPKDTFLKDDKYDISLYNFTPLEIGISKCFNKLYHPKLTLTNNTNTSDIFFLIDLDGTIINTDLLHFEGYKYALNKFNKKIDYSEYLNILNNQGIDNYLETNFKNDKIIIKDIKNKYIQNIDHINIIKNADLFIDYINKYNINHAVVTNTSYTNVMFFKSKLPILNKLKNWICREDYNIPKPDKESYELAINRFYNKEKYIIGFENSINGYKSLNNITKCIYIITDINNDDYKYFKNQDVYLINDYYNLFE